MNERQKHIAMTRLLDGRTAENLEHATVKQVLHMLWDWKLLVLYVDIHPVSTVYNILALAYSHDE